MRKLKVDPATRARLGRSLLDQVRARLWAVDCQTCGRPFDRDVPALVVHRDGDLATASLHHRYCRAPQWSDSPAPPSWGPPTVTWRAVTLLLEPRGLPIFLVNPSYEVLALRWTGTGWRVAGLDVFVAAGLSDYTDNPVQTEVVEELTAILEANRLRVAITIGDKDFSWSSAVGPAVVGALNERASLIVGVTQLLDPATGVTPDQVLSLMAGGHLACGIAEVGFAPAAQQPRPDDFDQYVRTEVFGVCVAAVGRVLGVAVDDRLPLAAFAACDGDPSALTGLTGRDRSIALVLVAALYATRSGDRAVHVLVPDDVAAVHVHAVFKPVFAELGVSVGRLPDYRADVVLGAPDQFAAARARNPQRRGGLAILVDAGKVAPELLTPYRRVIRLGDPPDVRERLMRERVIYLGTDIDDETANQLTAQLLLLAAEDPDADITFYLNSNGGSVSAAMAILDTMTHIEPDVATWVMGVAAGSAQVLLTGGAPGKRHALVDARVLLRLPSGPSNPDQLQREMLAKWTREIVELTARASGRPVEQVWRDAERQRWFTATEALKYGLVDRVVDRPGALP
jgi:ATP-dependent Clp protease protease subunit